MMIIEQLLLYYIKWQMQCKLKQSSQLWVNISSHTDKLRVMALNIYNK